MCSFKTNNEQEAEEHHYLKGHYVSDHEENA